MFQIIKKKKHCFINIVLQINYKLYEYILIIHNESVVELHKQTIRLYIFLLF